MLGYPEWMQAYGTIPIGYPAATQNRRYRRPLDQALHWNGYQGEKFRTHEQVDFYESTLRPFAMYRDEETLDGWEDRTAKLSDWDAAFTSATPNPSGELQPEADFTEPRVVGQATKRRSKNQGDPHVCPRSHRIQGCRPAGPAG
ncbi:hypothetical protein [Parasedimentitalea denitrificans]|nr:hypothetical protein [Sedimentitalea sp. CY04]